MSGRVEVVPPPPPVETRLFRWLTDVRAALGLETARTPVLLNGWVPHPGGGPPRYWRHGGMVHLAGALQGTGVGTTAFDLPVGLRPEAAVRFAVASDGVTPGLVEISAAGTVQPVSGNGPYGIWLDGISFRAGG